MSPPAGVVRAAVSRSRAGSLRWARPILGWAFLVLAIVGSSGSAHAEPGPSSQGQMQRRLEAELDMLERLLDESTDGRATSPNVGPSADLLEQMLARAHLLAARAPSSERLRFEQRLAAIEDRWRSSSGGGVDAEEPVVAGSGSISGRVTNLGGTPLDRVIVRVYDQDARLVGSRYTDSAGEYVFESLPPGDHYVVTRNELGYVELLYSQIECGAGVCDVTGGTPVPVTPGKVTTGVDFLMSEGGRLAGVVLERGTGLPVDSGVVVLYDSWGRRYDSTRSDPFGSVAVEDRPGSLATTMQRLFDTLTGAT